MQVWPNGANYKGKFVNGQKHGWGFYEWPDNSFYRGEWKDNKIKGKGVLTWPDGSTITIPSEYKK